MIANVSLPPSAPMTNGAASRHGEVDTSASAEATQTPLAEVCADLQERVSKFLSVEPDDETTRRTQDQTRISLEVIGKALQDYDFSALSLSYNGGKDCLVLLILYLAALHTHFTRPNNRRKPDETSDTEAFPTSIPSIYAKPPDPFPSVTSFVESSSTAYHLDLTHITTNPPPRTTKSHTHTETEAPTAQQPDDDLPNKRISQQPIITFRDAFALYLSHHPHIKAIFVGTRRTDPHGGHLTHFDQTDHNWPDFMRVHPVIDWHLSEIWCFLRSPHLRERDGSQLAYCTMYDEGYTSLGGVNDTLKNPKLKYSDDQGRVSFRPAYELTQDQEERLGRE